uniref:Uncharacterized protein n=1 Tax=Rhizophora mucronata TaxID=61149 RepID=A0A2P2PQL2_RHIMU
MFRDVRLKKKCSYMKLIA